MTRNKFLYSMLGVAILFCCATLRSTSAQGVAEPSSAGGRMEAKPKDLLDVGVSEQLNARLPLDLEFEDTDGKKVKLKDFFDGERPVILSLNYSNCPMLCSLQLTGLFYGLEEMEWELGDKFQMVSVSIDPAESSTRAKLTKRKYLKQYGRAGGASGLHFLVGEQENIRALAEAVGFRYKYKRETDEYVHAAATIFITPDGRVSRYLYTVEFSPQTLKMALLEASEGKIGSTADRFLLYCYQYDAVSGKYAPAALQIMKVAAALAVIILGCVLLMYWIRESRKSAAAKADPTSEAHPT